MLGIVLAARGERVVLPAAEVGAADPTGRLLRDPSQRRNMRQHLFHPSLIASCGDLSVDHGQKREPSDVTTTRGLDFIGPIAEGRVFS